MGLAYLALSANAGAPLLSDNDVNRGRLLMFNFSYCIIPTPTMSVDVGWIFEFVCLSVCLSVCPQHNSETNHPKVFKFV